MDNTDKPADQMNIKRCVASLIVVPAITIGSAALLGFIGYWIDESVNGDAFLSGVMGGLIGVAIGLLFGFSASLYFLVKTRLTRSPAQLLCMAVSAPLLTILALGFLESF